MPTFTCAASLAPTPCRISCLAYPDVRLHIVEAYIGGADRYGAGATTSIFLSSPAFEGRVGLKSRACCCATAKY